MAHVAIEGPDSVGRIEAVHLYTEVGWTAYTRDPETLMRGLNGSHRIVTARNDDRLIGLARSISDGATIVYLQDVLVEPAAQRHGIGRRLVETLFDSYTGVRQHVLLTDSDKGQRAFYESLGFTETADTASGVRAFVRLLG